MVKQENIFAVQSILEYIKTQHIQYKNKDYTLQIRETLYQLLILYVPNIQDYLDCDSVIISKDEIAKKIFKLRKRFLINKYDYRVYLKFQFETLISYFEIDCTSLDYQSLFRFTKNNEQELLDKIPYYKEFKSYINDIKLYFALPKKNVVVCGTMSAGKSSFINALVGTKLLPARNEPTTAKITSIFDNDYFGEFSGYYIDSVGTKILKTLDSKILDDISDKNEVDRIYIQGNINNLVNSNSVITIHDTPGTNNSSNDEHFRTTSNFLKNTDIDVLIFVANICYLKTQDEKKLLLEISDICQKDESIIPIFILNKVDKIELKDESIPDIYNSYKDYLSDIGFDNIELLLVSSKTALLTKMVLENQASSFTDSEIDDYNCLFRKFLKRLDLSGEKKQSIEEKEIIYVVDGNEYKSDELKNVYIRTGMYEIEKKIESIIKESENAN